MLALLAASPRTAQKRVQRAYNEDGMEVTIKVPDKLAAEARARGLSVEVYVQEILARQTPEATGEQRVQSVRAAIDRIFELRKGNKLAGLRTKDLIHEGHKY
jgi:hypothetical protein